MEQRYKLASSKHNINNNNNNPPAATHRTWHTSPHGQNPSASLIHHREGTITCFCKVFSFRNVDQQCLWQLASHPLPEGLRPESCVSPSWHNEETAGVMSGLWHSATDVRVRALNGLTAGFTVEEHRCLSPMITAAPNKNDICLTVKLDTNLSESESPFASNKHRQTVWHTFPLNALRKRSHPLAHGNGPLLLATEDVALFIPADDWKENWIPFDVINVSITAFAHKMSVEIIVRRQGSEEKIHRDRILASFDWSWNINVLYQ